MLKKVARGSARRKFLICHAHFWRRRSADSTKLVAIDDHLPHSQRTRGGAMPSMPDKWWGYSPTSPTVCAAPGLTVVQTNNCTVFKRKKTERNVKFATREAQVGVAYLPTCHKWTN